MYLSFTITGTDDWERVQTRLRALPRVEYAMAYDATDYTGRPWVNGQINFTDDVFDASLVADYLDVGAISFYITRVHAGPNAKREPSGATIVFTNTDPYFDDDGEITPLGSSYARSVAKALPPIVKEWLQR